MVGVGVCVDPKPQALRGWRRQHVDQRGPALVPLQLLQCLLLLLPVSPGGAKEEVLQRCLARVGRLPGAAGLELKYDTRKPHECTRRLMGNVRGLVRTKRHETSGEDKYAEERAPSETPIAVQSA